MRVEYLLARQDGTWDTVVQDVPIEGEDGMDPSNEKLEAWALETFLDKPEYNNVVLAAVYGTTDGESY